MAQKRVTRLAALFAYERSVRNWNMERMAEEMDKHAPTGMKNIEPTSVNWVHRTETGQQKRGPESWKLAQAAAAWAANPIPGIARPKTFEEYNRDILQALGTPVESITPDDPEYAELVRQAKSIPEAREILELLSRMNPRDRLVAVKTVKAVAGEPASNGRRH